MLCTNVFYSKRLTKYYPNYLLYNVIISNNLVLCFGLKVGFCLANK
jgi:hypothetical protein